jgi:hypothetical protein
MGGNNMVDQLSDSTSENNLEDIDYDDDDLETINYIDHAAGEDHHHGNGGIRRPTKKRYHRHTTHQIQEMER